MHPPCELRRPTIPRAHLNEPACIRSKHNGRASYIKRRHLLISHFYVRGEMAGWKTLGHEYEKDSGSIPALAPQVEKYIFCSMCKLWVAIVGLCFGNEQL